MVVATSNTPETALAASSSRSVSISHESNNMILHNDSDKQLSLEMPQNHHTVQDQNLEECSNFSTLTETSNRKLSPANNLSPIIRWKNIGTSPKWEKEIYLPSSNLSTGSSKGTLQTAVTGTTYTVNPESVTTISNSQSASNDYTERSSDNEWFGDVKLKSVKLNDSRNEKLESKSKSIEKELAKPGLDGVVPDANVHDMNVNEHKYQDKRNVTQCTAEDKDTGAFYPLIQQASTITTEGTAYFKDHDDDDDFFVYYSNEDHEDPLTYSQLSPLPLPPPPPPPPPSKLDPTGMVISASNIYLTQEEIYDPTLLDDEDDDENEGNSPYASSNLGQMFRTPSHGNSYMGMHTIERIPSGTSSISFSCASTHSSSSSTSSTGESENGYLNYCPSSLSVTSHESPVSRNSCESNQSLKSYRGSIAADTDSGESARVSQVDMVDMGRGAIAVSGKDYRDEPLFDLVSGVNGIGFKSNRKNDKDEDEDDDLNNAYLPAGLLSPPRVERRDSLSNLSGCECQETYQEDQDEDKVDSFYLPLGLWTPSNKCKESSLPKQPLSINGNEEEMADDNATDRLINLKDSDSQSFSIYKDEDDVPYDEYLNTSIGTPQPNPEIPPIKFRTKKLSPLPSTVKPLTTTLAQNHTPIKCESLPSPNCDSKASAASSNYHTQDLSNSSTPRSIALNDSVERRSCFLSDNWFLSILDCPGRMTRKKRERRNTLKKPLKGESYEQKGVRRKLRKAFHLPHRNTKRISKAIQSLRQVKDMKEGNDDGGAVGECRWGEIVVKDAIERMNKCNKSHNENEIGQSRDLDAEPYVDDDGMIPMKRSRSEKDSRWRLSTDEPIDILAKESQLSVIDQWEQHAMWLLQRMEFEKSSFLYHKILRTYQSRINQHKLVDADKAKCEAHIGSTLHNIGVVYLFSERYDLACEWLQKASAARASCLGYNHMDHIITVSRMGLAYYAQDEFSQACQTWKDALNLLRQLPSTLRSSSNAIAEFSLVLNNIACAEFEIGQVESAVRTFRKAVKVYRAGTTERCAVESQKERDVALKLAILRSNVGYCELRMKRGELAIEAFETALVDQEKIQDSHTIVMSILDHLVLAYLRKGQEYEVFKVYSQLLKIQIEVHGPNHSECQKTLTKINLLESGVNCNHLLSATEKVKDCYLSSDVNNHDQQCHYQEVRQLERFEKLLKVPNTWGRISFSIRSKHL